MRCKLLMMLGFLVMAAGCGEAARRPPPLSEGRPELEPAVKKSREALADRQATLDFLLEGQVAESPAP